ncbi:MAG: branched-chain amino acid ABC transporter permease [Candidatus Eremiobacteraeota bacterium]|nr:branched-chain amino acid ABC transporter permease [Candidatus Eremiobacteraeota bacterium]
MQRHVAVMACVLAATALFTAFCHDQFLLSLAFTGLIFAVLGQSWNWISGYAGQVSFGHALFFGTGAYASALFATHHGSPWLALACGAAVAVVLALLVGFPCFALRGHYFSIATIAVAAIAEIVVVNTDALGKANGFELPILPPGLASLQFAGKAPYVLVALVLFAAAQIATVALEHSRTGYYLRAIRANQEAAASVGVDARAVKVTAFAGAAAFAALAGSLYAQQTLFVDAESTLGLSVSIAIALVGVVGGIGTVWGPPLGAFVYTFLARYVAALYGGHGRGFDLLLYGALILAIVSVQPEGIAGIARRFRART